MVKHKLKPLLPILKEKKRYVVFEVISQVAIPLRDIKDAILQAAFRWMGAYGMAKAGITVLDDRWSPQKNRGIIKVSHTSTDMLKSALMFVTAINSVPVIIKSCGVSGMIKKADSKFIRGEF